MLHPEYPVISFLCIPLLLSSLRSHIRAGSVATIALITWMVVLNIIRGINSIIWDGNVDIRFEVWCDITTKLTIGWTFAVPLCMLCVCKHLENVSSNRQAVITRKDRRRRIIFELIMCIIVPMIFMALHYVVQGHRYDLIEDFGCYPTTYFSVAGILIVWVPPLLISFITMGYALAALYHFLRRRIEFAAVLKNSNSALTPSRYFRLMALVIWEIFWDGGINIYVLWANASEGLRPWISWQNVHSNFSRIAVFPFILIPESSIKELVVEWWILPISSVGVFIFFAFGNDAMADYRAFAGWIKRHIFRMKTRSSVQPTMISLPRHNVTSMASVNSSISGSRPKPWDTVSTPSVVSTPATAEPHEHRISLEITPISDTDTHDEPSLAQHSDAERHPRDLQVDTISFAV